jgi:hypothetical protein
MIKQGKSKKRPSILFSRDRGSFFMGKMEETVSVMGDGDGQFKSTITITIT